MKSTKSYKKRLNKSSEVSQSQTPSAACCSTCLATDRTLFALYETPQLVDIYCSGLCGLDLSATDMVCFECRARLNSFVKFRSRAQRARKVLSRVPASARSSEFKMLEVFYASDVKCLSTLTHKYSTPYDTIYMNLHKYIGDEIQQIEINSESDTKDSLLKLDGVSRYKPSVIKVEKLEVLSSNMEDISKIEEYSEIEIDLKSKIEDKTNIENNNDSLLLQVGGEGYFESETVAEGDGNGVFNEFGADESELNTTQQYDDDQDTSVKDCVESTEKKKPSALQHFTKTEIDLGAVLSQMMTTLQTAKYQRANFKCDSCAQHFCLEHNFRAHLELHSEERGDFSCSICQQRFKDDYKLQQHTDAHYTRYECKYCHRQYENNNQMYTHYNTVHEDQKPRECSRCSQTFITLKQLRQHVAKKHSTSSLFPCQMCDRSFTCKRALTRHMMNHDSSLPLLECSVCHKNYRGEHALKMHLRNVHKKATGTFYCVECDKKFKRESSYKLHLATTKHSGRDFECDYCSKKLASKYTLTRHIQARHLRLAQYKCQICHQEFHTASARLVHLQRKHPKKPPKQFECYHCSKVFTRSEQLRDHINMHLDLKPHQCERCDAAFSFRSALYVHKRTVHVDNIE